MHFTNFAGLTAPDPDDPITVDGGTFVTRNPDLTDHFLRIGAVTHRHDGHAALVDPTAPASADVVPSGGSIPASVTIYAGYTVTDSAGGETVLSPAVSTGTPAGYGPPSATIGASADYTGGALPAGNWYYAKSNIDAGGGETPLGPMTTITRDPGYASGQINFAGLAADVPAGGAWHLWRSQDGQYMTLLASGTSDTYTDAGANAGADPTYQPPDIDSSRSTNTLELTLPTAAQEPAIASGTQINVYLSLDGSFANPCLYNVYPVASAGATLQIPSVDTNNGEPPAVSTSIAGADKIDPDTELLNWHWKQPVPTAADLPAGPADGDARVVIAERLIYVASGGSWSLPSDVDQQSIALVSDDHGGSASSPNAIEFVGSGGASATVTASGGSAVVTITPPPDSDTAAFASAVDGQGDVASGTVLKFVGSGGASASVQASGASAVVTITATAGSGGGGGGTGGGIQGNASAATENFGRVQLSLASAASGSVVVAHGLGSAATNVQLTTNDPLLLAACTAVDNTNMTIAVRYVDGVARTASPVIWWAAVAGTPVTPIWNTLATYTPSSPLTGWTMYSSTFSSDAGLYATTNLGTEATGAWTSGPTVPDNGRVAFSFVPNNGNSQAIGAGMVISDAYGGMLVCGYKGNVGHFSLWNAHNSELAFATPSISLGTTYYGRLTRNGNQVTAELFTSDPGDSNATPLATINYTLTGADATDAGVGVNGKAGALIIPGSGETNAEHIDWIRVETPA